MANNTTTMFFMSIIVLFTLDQERNGFKTVPIAATIAAGLVFPFIQLLGTLAQQYGKIGIITLLNYMNIPLLFLVDIFIFNETFNAQQLIGLGLVIFVTFSVAYYKLTHN